jgi:hypothetical protein
MPVNAPLPSAPEHSSVQNAAHPFFNKVLARACAQCRFGERSQRIAPDKQIDSLCYRNQNARARGAPGELRQGRVRTSGNLLRNARVPARDAFTFLVSAGSRSATSDP